MWEEADEPFYRLPPSFCLPIDSQLRAIIVMSSSYIIAGLLLC